MFLRQCYLRMAYILFLLNFFLFYSPSSLHLCMLLVIFRPVIWFYYYGRVGEI
jgi:hypothetical protein